MANTINTDAIQGTNLTNLGIYAKFDGTISVTNGGLFTDSASSYLLDVRGYSYCGISALAVDDDLTFTVTSAYLEYVNLEDLVADDFEIELLTDEAISQNVNEIFDLDIKDSEDNFMATALWITFKIVTNPSEITGVFRTAIKPYHN